MHRSTNNGAGREEMSNCEHRPRPNTAIEKLYTLITTGRVFEFQNRYNFGVTRIKKKKKRLLFNVSSTSSGAGMSTYLRYLKYSTSDKF